MLPIMHTVAGLLPLIAAQQAAPSPDAVRRWSVLMLGLALLALFIIVAGLVLAARRRARRNRAHVHRPPQSTGIAPWAEAGRRTPTPDSDDPDLPQSNPHGEDRD